MVKTENNFTIIRDEETGGAGVEFGLILPVLLLILIAIIEYGWLMTTRIVLFNSVSAGARAGIKADEFDGEDPEVFARMAVKESFWVGALEDDQILAEIEDEGDSVPRRINVRVEKWLYQPITGYLPEKMLPDVLAAKSVMAFP